MSTDRGLSEGLAVTISAIVGLVVATLVTWLASSMWGVFFEELFRINPVIGGGQPGVGADWVAGNTMTSLNFLISLTHAADVLMGLFILLMVFIHWGAFRRLAAQMRQPGETYRSDESVATDGGERP